VDHQKNKSSSSHNNNNNNVIVYLDTTYCDPKYTFPPQECAINAVIDLVREAAYSTDVSNNNNSISGQKKKEKILFLFGAYAIGNNNHHYTPYMIIIIMIIIIITIIITIGKERVYLQVAKTFQTLIYVDKQRWKMILCYSDLTIEEKALFTTNPQATHFWVVSLNQLNFNFIGNLKLQWLKNRLDNNNNHNHNSVDAVSYDRVVAFQPTGWTFTSNNNKYGRSYPSTSNNNSDNDNSHIVHKRCKDNDIIYGIAYSEHSSFDELIDFIRIFQ
jgi:DNA cross-link repair 1A protein